MWATTRLWRAPSGFAFCLFSEKLRLQTVSLKKQKANSYPAAPVPETPGTGLLHHCPSCCWCVPTLPRPSVAACVSVGASAHVPAALRSRLSARLPGTRHAPPSPPPAAPIAATAAAAHRRPRRAPLAPRRRRWARRGLLRGSPAAAGGVVAVSQGKPCAPPTTSAARVCKKGGGHSSAHGNSARLRHRIQITRPSARCTRTQQLCWGLVSMYRRASLYETPHARAAFLGGQN